MKNLQNFGVQELSAKEIKQTDGGIFGLDDLIVGCLIAVVVGVVNDWDNFKIGLSGDIK
tara:strand:+ start:1178 stop:1354 length:177 start_codon:yes stop_codon:yes gene_type:complete